MISSEQDTLKSLQLSDNKSFNKTAAVFINIKVFRENTSVEFIGILLVLRISVRQLDHPGVVHRHGCQDALLNSHWQDWITAIVDVLPCSVRIIQQNTFMELIKLNNCDAISLIVLIQIQKLWGLQETLECNEGFLLRWTPKQTVRATEKSFKAPYSC